MQTVSTRAGLAKAVAGLKIGGKTLALVLQLGPSIMGRRP